MQIRTSDITYGGSGNPCSASGGRDFICTHPNSTAIPWIVGETVVVRIVFVIPAALVPAATPSSGVLTIPSPTTAAEVQSPFGSRDRDKDITLGSVNSAPTGIWSDGTTMWVLDSTDNKAYAYSLISGARDTGKDFNTDPCCDSQAIPVALFRDGNIFWVLISSPSSSGIDFITPHTVTTEADGSITVVRGSRTLIPSSEESGRTVEGMWRSTSNGNVFISQRIPNNQQRMYQATLNSRTWSRFTPTGTPIQYYGIWGDDGRSIIWTQVSTGTGRYEMRSDSIHTLLDPDTLRALTRYTFAGPQGAVVHGMWGNSETMWIPSASDDKLYAYHISTLLLTDETRAFAQSPPAILSVEIGDGYELGDADVADLTMTWQHTSRVLQGYTVMEYRYKSTITGAIGPIRTVATPAEAVISSIPRANYGIEIELRYKWINDSNSVVVVSNPPTGTASKCRDTDAITGDDLEGEDLDTIGCAFVIAIGGEKVSAWSEIFRINVTSSLSPVPDTSPSTRPQYGFTGIIAEGMLVVGVNPETVGSLAKTFTVITWLGMATGVAALLFVGTGMTAGSMYVATFTWLIIWAGLGPFIAGIPYAMAYMPAAALLFMTGIVAIKRGKVIMDEDGEKLF